jgi:hypothetical protein
MRKIRRRCDGGDALKLGNFFKNSYIFKKTDDIWDTRVKTPAADAKGPMRPLGPEAPLKQAGKGFPPKITWR